KNNTMINNYVDFSVSKNIVTSNEINPSNMVNNKPIYYYKNEKNIIAPKGGGQYIFANVNYSKILDTTTNGGAGITLYYSKSNMIRNNTISNCLNSGVRLWNSCNNSIINNVIFNNSLYGIYLSYSDNSSIISNDISLNNYDGIHIKDSNNNSIIKNDITYNTYDGIDLYNSNEYLVDNNNASYNYQHGISLRNGNTIGIVNNNTCIKNEYYGIYINEGENVNLSQNILKNNSYGINIRWLKYSILKNNSITDNDYGVYLYWAHNNTLMFNNVSYNRNNGIWLYGAKENNLSLNWIEFNNFGVILEQDTNENKLFNNTFYHNHNYSILIKPDGLIPDGNSIFYNDFIYNNNGGIQALDNGTNNKWNFTTGGNYWSDYSGIDSNGDGFGDTDYYLDGTSNSKDSMPLMVPIFNTPPQINDPSDFTMIQGDTQNYIIWQIFDREMNYGSYWVLRNGILIKYGNWNSSIKTVNITNLDILSPGIYNFTCFVNDTAGLKYSSTIIVTIKLMEGDEQEEDDRKESKFPLIYLVIIFIIVFTSIIGITLIFIFFIKKKRLKSKI
ncbi:MAG: right-handed parallel beta-helix repeat-containing protein, partial [Promethearchaeota archaeon]